MKSLKPLCQSLLTGGILCACLVLLASPLPVRAQPKPVTAWETARQFYLWTLRHPGQGLPSAQAQAQLKTWLAPDVSKLLQQALSAEVSCYKATPKDTKPPVAEGDLFVNNYEGATVLNRLKVVQQAGETLLEAELAYVDKRFPPGHHSHEYRWSDRLTLAQFSGQWRIKDISFKDRPSLVAMLKDYLVELKKCASKS